MKSYLALLALATSASAHSFIAEPAAGRRLPFGETRHISSGPCGVGKSSGNPSKLTYKRGQSVEIKWPRNNHPGGFIRLALVPFQNSDNKEAFEQNIIHYNCHESNCRSGYYTDLLGGDPEGAQEHSNLCSNSFTIPTWAQNGQYTLQWTWFGGGSWYGKKYEAQHTYVSCVDFTVAGYEQVETKAQDFCPVFKGGDAQNPGGDKCLYFLNNNANELQVDQCSYGGCAGKYVSGQPPQYAKCVANGGKTQTYAQSVAPATNPAPKVQDQPVTPAVAPATNPAPKVQDQGASGAGSEPVKASYDKPKKKKCRKIYY